MPTQLELYSIPNIYLKEESLPQNETTWLTDQERDTLQKVSGAVVQAIGKEDAYKATIVGGVALRLLEKTVGIPNKGVFSGNDIDVMYCDNDNTNLEKLRAAARDLEGTPRLDINRFLRSDEANSAIFHKIVQDPQGILSSTALLGRIKDSIDHPLEILEIDFDSENPVYTLSPSNLFHLYALRAVGGVKKRDWVERKPHRLLEANKKLNEMLDVELKNPYEYPEFTRFRKISRQGLLPKLLVTAVCMDNALGRPYEKLGLNSIIR